MHTVLVLKSFDELFHRLMSEKFLINEIDIFNTQNKEMLDNFIMKNYSEDNLTLLPQCQMGHLPGHLKGSYYLGDVCPLCKTTVTSSIDDAISFLLWLKQPQKVERFISPIVMAFLLRRYRITKPQVSLVEYIMLPNMKIDKKQQRQNQDKLDKLDYLLSRNNIAKGYNSFVQNFFKIIEILEAEFVKHPRSKDPLEFLNFLLKNRNEIFSSYLPFPNKMIFTMESNELGRYFDKSLVSPINVIRRLTGIDIRTLPASMKQARVARSLIDMAYFYEDYLSTKIFSKPGLIRQHVTSERTHFTARAVIVSIAGPHAHDEVHINWSGACTLLRPYILNRLYKRGYSYKNAVNFLLYHNRIYSPILDEIFQEIIAASPGGLKAFFNRNPSLHRGSIQTVRITKVKPDPLDPTFSMSDRIGPAFNSDHDGDEMNLYLLTTQKLYRTAKYLEPYNNILGLSGPDEFSNNIKFPKTIVSTLANWANA
jgi:hypothetical protein